MPLKIIIFLIFLTTIALISNAIAETVENETNYNELEDEGSFMNLSETEYMNDSEEEYIITNDFNIDAPETVEAGKEYEIKVTDKEGNPAEGIVIDIIVNNEEWINATTNKEGIITITPATSGGVEAAYIGLTQDRHEPLGF